MILPDQLTDNSTLERALAVDLAALEPTLRELAGDVDRLAHTTEPTEISTVARRIIERRALARYLFDEMTSAWKSLDALVDDLGITVIRGVQT